MKMLSLVFAFLSALAFAEPTITLSRVQQRYPWNGLVDIDYTVSGMDGTPADYVVTFDWSSASAKASGTATNFVGIVWCDLSTANGSYRVTWDAAADGLDFLARDFSLTAKLTYAPVSEAEADYAIIDLTAGQSATEYPVRYCKTGADYPTSHFNCNRYKAGRLAMKKLKSDHFWMGVGNVSTGTGATRHRVYLSDDYWLGIFEVTQGQIKNVTGVVKSDYQVSVGSVLAEERPESHISYDDTMHPTAGMIARLNLRVKLGETVQTGFNLPSEAEWEYACRAGTETIWSWGSDSDADIYQYAWTSGNSDSMTHPVGGKLPNNWGFYDMHGNASEWCRDWGYHYPMYKEGLVSTNPVGTVWTRFKICRGGSFHPVTDFRATGSGVRNNSSTQPNQTGGGHNPSMSSRLGFRLFKSLTSAEKANVSPVLKSSSALANLKVDLRTATVKKILKLDELLPLAWNSDANWPADGDPLVTAGLRVVLASGDDKTDPTTWTDGGAETLTAGAGEGTTAWEPTQASLARVELTQGTTVLSGYLDLTDCEGLESAESIKDFTATFAAFDVACDGYAKTPKVTLTDKDGAELEEDVDYSVTYANNVNVGEATVTIAGIGDYEGTIVTNFTITARQPEPRAQSSLDGRIDERFADGEPVVVPTWRDLPALVWNDSTDWRRGGVSNELNMVRVTADRLAGETPTGRLVTILDGCHGEDESAWKRLRHGDYLLVSTLYRRNKATDSTWTLNATNATRRIRITTTPGVVLRLR